MEKQQLHNIKNRVIDAFVRHELGQELTMSDKVYDDLLAQIMHEDPSFNIYDFKPISEGAEYVQHRSGITWLEKEYTHDIEMHWNEECDEPRLPKYDGSSLVIYYTNGKLSSIVSMSDKDTGIDQTEKFKSFVPQKIDPSISFLRCECVIDMRKTDNARGKANGLVNSKYLQEEVEELASLICFAGHDLEGKKISFDDLWRYISEFAVFREDGTPRFMVSPDISSLTYSHGVVMHKGIKSDFQFAIDGIVYYNSEFAYKYDYITSAITTITEVNWSETDKEGFFATLSIEPVELDGSMIYNPSSNGTPNMIRMGLGKGAVVEVARSGLTIPKILNCITPTEVEFPVCPHCGYQMSEDDLYGSTLKCGNPKCTGRYENRKQWMKDWIEGLEGGIEEAINWMLENVEEGLFWLLNISRFNYESRRNFTSQSIQSILNQLIIKSNNVSSDEVLEYLGESHSWTDLQWAEAQLNIWSTWEVIKDLMNHKL